MLGSQACGHVGATMVRALATRVGVEDIWQHSIRHSACCLNGSSLANVILGEWRQEHPPKIDRGLVRIETGSSMLESCMLYL